MLPRRVGYRPGRAWIFLFTFSSPSFIIGNPASHLISSHRVNTANGWQAAGYYFIRTDSIFPKHGDNRSGRLMIQKKVGLPFFVGILFWSVFLLGGPGHRSGPYLRLTQEE